MKEKSFLEMRLYYELQMLIKNGAQEFWLGGYGAFDLLAAKVVKQLKKKYPHIRSVLVLAYLHQRYEEELYDETEYPPLEKVPKSLAIIKRNEYMVKQSDAIVSYVIYSFGGAAQTVQFALRNQKTVICMANGNKKGTD